MTYRSVAKADVAELSAALDSAVSPEKAHHLVIVSTNKVLSTTQFKQLFYSRGDDFFQIANVYECPDSCDSVHSSVWGIDCQDPHSPGEAGGGAETMGHDRLTSGGGTQTGGVGTTYQCYNFNKLGGRENDPEGCAWAYSYVHDQSRNFYAQHEVMGYLEKDTCVKRDFWTACSRMSIEDQLYGLAFASETDQDLCMAVTCARRWSEVEDALAESCTAADITIVDKPQEFTRTPVLPNTSNHEHGMHLPAAQRDDDSVSGGTSPNGPTLLNSINPAGGTNTFTIGVNGTANCLSDLNAASIASSATTAGQWHLVTLSNTATVAWLGNTAGTLGEGGWYEATLTAANFTLAPATNNTTINGMAPITIKIQNQEYKFWNNGDEHKVCFHIADEKTHKLNYYIRTNSVYQPATTNPVVAAVNGTTGRIQWAWKGASVALGDGPKKPGQHVDLYINVRVSNGHPKALDTILRVRFTVKYMLHEPSAIHTWNTRASTAAAGVIYYGVVGDAPEGGKQQHEDTTVVN